ncbi:MULTISPECIES: TraB/GumN family protein [Maricaulis]|uniref:TraB/GumN family protein n=1 Tax=Maricaulis TaxID=74317 RepID=UPI000C5F5922|nr:TraB/GumN family protein [Maricaulis sp.]MAC87956.1 TraB/GumN family protein [Maricaulis sp.]
MFTFTSMRRTVSALSGAALLAGGALLSSTASAQQTDFSSVEADPAIWHLSDTDSDVYIFGTFHILPPSLDWRSEELRALIASTDMLVLEADVHSPESQAAMQPLVMQYGLNPSGVTLSSLLSDTANASLAEIAPTVGFAPAMLEPMRPWLAQIALAVGQMQALGLDPNAGVEMVLLGMVEGREMRMGYFETAEQQLGFLAGMPDDVQARAFEQGLEDMAELPTMLDTLVTAWAVGDMETIDSEINASMREDAPEAYQVMIVQRNENWIPQIAEIMDGEGTVFIAVGAAHLPGENGVIELLREQGYEVSRQ